MKLSARARYAVRILLDLAVHEEETPVSTVMLSERTGITLPFVEQLLKPLKRSGLVASKRGAAGGYRLNRVASEISLGEVIRIMDGSLSLTNCCEDEKYCLRSGDCSARETWKRLNAVIVGAFDAIRLSDVIGGVPVFSAGGPDLRDTGPL